MKTILLLGGYGTFGQRIATALAGRSIPVIIAGRHLDKAHAFQQRLLDQFQEANITTAAINCDDITDMHHHLDALAPFLVINTCGPFQSKDYRVATACIEYGCHYLDLADARDYVTGFTHLHRAAQQAGVCVITGASTVPALSAAVIDHFLPQFSHIHRLSYGITPGQRAPRGLATTKAILSYLGRPIHSAATRRPRYGWQNSYRQPYPELGKRWMGSCDIPDLDLFPPRYPIDELHFAAGMESHVLHLSIWALSWLVRLRLPLNLTQHASRLLRLSHWFDYFGSDSGGMHMQLQGLDHQQRHKNVTWYLIAHHGDGPQIPCVPAIWLTTQMTQPGWNRTGAYPCLDLITLDDYLNELHGFAIHTHIRESN